MIDWKYQLAFACIALINVLTATLQEWRARERYKVLGRGLREVQVSLHPPPGPPLVFDADATPRDSQCVDRAGHLWTLAEHEIVWRCRKCPATYTDEGE